MRANILFLSNSTSPSSHTTVRTLVHGGFFKDQALYQRPRFACFGNLKTLLRSSTLLKLHLSGGNKSQHRAVLPLFGDSHPTQLLGCWLKVSRSLHLQKELPCLKIRPFVNTSVLTTMASADFCFPLRKQISRGK